VLLAAGVASADDDGGGKGLHKRMQAAKDRVFPALVHIVNIEEGFAGGRRSKSVSSGSGFLIDADGHIVTNYHVAGRGRKILVTLASKRKLEATIVAADPYTDLALLRVDAKAAFPDDDPVFAAFGDSSSLREGDFVMAMGSPLSLSRSVSFGIVSARERSLGSLELGDNQETGRYNTWIQTDAAINPGNSGGPLVDLDGNVVGVNTRATLIANNIGFAIPSNVVREVVAALLAHGSVPRAYLGLQLQPVEELADTALSTGREGALVAAVDADSPAERAGVRPGDVVTHLDGAPFGARFEEQVPELYRRIAALPFDRPAQLVLRRSDARVECVAVPAPLGRQIGRETDVGRWGITVRGITPRMRLELGLPDTSGVLVTGVRAGGPAAGRLETGDVIRTVQGEDIHDFGGFLEQAVASVEARETLVRIIVRRGAVMDVTVLRPGYDAEEEE
jgi:serine protease Do